MLIQQASLYEKAVDFLLELIASKRLEDFAREDIRELIQHIKVDIEDEFEIWKESEVRCDWAEKLRCAQDLDDCRSGQCPYSAFAEESHAMFFIKLERLIKKILTGYGCKADDDQEEKLTARQKMEKLHKDWQQSREADQKRLAVKIAKEKVEMALDDFLWKRDILAKWVIKARKRKIDGQVILNVNLDKDFLDRWPMSLQVKLRELRKPMRTADELVAKIEECGQALQLELDIQKRARKKRKKSRQKQRRMRNA